jgi:hypothetical protein
MQLAVLSAALGIALTLAAQVSQDSRGLFEQAVAALEHGATTEAIDRFELLADRGFVHPDASFDRAAAYVERARGAQARPGDLGRAAAALAEVLELRPDDREAELGLDKIRAEISRRHVREGVAPVMARPSLARAACSLLDENTWAGFAALGSLLLAAGLFTRRFLKATNSGVVGGVAIGVGAALLATCAALTAGARHFRLSSEPAVVIVEEGRLLDEAGKPLAKGRGSDAVSVPEGASVYVLERRPNLDRVEWGGVEGWLTPGELRVLATRASL